MSRMWASLTVAVVFLLTSSHADICDCGGIHLQRDYCTDSVIKLKTISIVEIHRLLSDNPSEHERNMNSKCVIEVLEVYRGRPELKNATFMAPHFKCPGYLLDLVLNTTYLVTGYFMSGEVVFTPCHSVFPWCKVTEQQLKGIQGEYEKGCSCAIADKEGGWFSNWCLQDKPEQQANQRCAPKTNDTCDWEDIPV